MTSIAKAAAWLGAVAAGAAFLTLAPAAVVANDPPAAVDQAALEKQFAEKMSGVALEGSFTITGKEGPPRKETYVISKVTKLEGKNWLFQARIKYGQHDVELPIPIKVEWAGDTPVLVLDKTTIPGMGTFTCRVLFYEEHYVGYWRHDETRGGMSGVVKKLGPDGKPVVEEKKTVEKTPEAPAEPKKP